MNLTGQIAKQLRDVHFGGNWTASNLKDQLSGVTWQEATTPVDSLNTIAVLVFHMNYYVKAILKVIRKEPLNAKDKYSFDLPPIQNHDDWEKLLAGTWTDAEDLAQLIEQMPESKLQEDFWEDKYGNYFRNFTGVIEHIHYHLGQIVIIKKILK